MKPKLVIINWEDAITPTSGWTNISGSDTQVDIDGSLVLDKSWIKYRKDLPLPKETINKLKKWLLENVDAQKNR